MLGGKTPLDRGTIVAKKMPRGELCDAIQPIKTAGGTTRHGKIRQIMILLTPIARRLGVDCDNVMEAAAVNEAAPRAHVYI